MGFRNSLPPSVSTARPTEGVGAAPSQSHVPGTKPLPALTGPTHPGLPGLFPATVSLGSLQPIPGLAWTGWGRTPSLGGGQQGFVTGRVNALLSAKRPAPHLRDEGLACMHSITTPGHYSHLQKMPGLPPGARVSLYPAWSGLPRSTCLLLYRRLLSVLPSHTWSLRRTQVFNNSLPSPPQGLQSP